MKPITFWKILAIVGWILFYIVLYCWLWFPDLEASEPREEICISGIIQIESSGNPYAVSKDGCIGLMQISRAVFEEWLNCGNRNFAENFDAVLFNPDYNKKIGTWYINERIPQLLEHYGIPDTIENRLIAYHDGIGNLIKYKQGKRKLGKEMQSYLKKYKDLVKSK